MIIIHGWAAVAAESLRLQEEGVPGMEAWAMAAGEASSPIRGSRPTGVQDSVVGWVAAQSEPVTVAEIAAGLGMGQSRVADTVRRAERRHRIEVVGRRGQGGANLWRAT